MKTTNELAVFLVFYNYYQRDKFNLSVLSKVANKYILKNPNNRFNDYATSIPLLLKDLYKKYTDEHYIQFKEADFDEVIYIVQKYFTEMPKEFFHILQKVYDSSKPIKSITFQSLSPYDPSLDIFSERFNPIQSLSSRNLLLPVDLTLFPAQDNLSKVSSLLPKEVIFEKEEGLRLATFPADVVDETYEDIMALLNKDKIKPAVDVNPSEKEELKSESNNSFRDQLYEKRQKEKEIEIEQRRQQQQERQEAHSRMLETIAERAIPRYISVNQMGEKCESPSPLQLLYDLMKEKARVRVLVRRRTSIRGSVDGYLVGFDRFWNLLLKDCDEEFIPNHFVSCSTVVCFVYQWLLLFSFLFIRKI
jgi:small nuclear ribonucleoprotein (snRNP)-like protein